MRASVSVFMITASLFSIIETQIKLNHTVKYVHSNQKLGESAEQVSIRMWFGGTTSFCCFFFSLMIWTHGIRSENDMTAVIYCPRDILTVDFNQNKNIDKFQMNLIWIFRDKTIIISHHFWKCNQFRFFDGV